MGGGINQGVNFQIWRSVSVGVYSRVTEVVYSRTVAGETIATVPVSMSVTAGDMVGFYVPNGQLRLHTAPDVGITILSAGATSSTTLSNLPTIVGQSPYITVDFGESGSMDICNSTLYLMWALPCSVVW